MAVVFNTPFCIPILTLTVSRKGLVNIQQDSLNSTVIETSSCIQVRSATKFRMKQDVKKNRRLVAFNKEGALYVSFIFLKMMNYVSLRCYRFNRIVPTFRHAL